MPLPPPALFFPCFAKLAPWRKGTARFNGKGKGHSARFNAGEKLCIAMLGKSLRKRASLSLRKGSASRGKKPRGKTPGKAAGQSRGQSRGEKRFLDEAKRPPPCFGKLAPWRKGTAASLSVGKALFPAALPGVFSAFSMKQSRGGKLSR